MKNLLFRFQLLTLLNLQSGDFRLIFSEDLPFTLSSFGELRGDRKEGLITV